MRDKFLSKYKSLQKKWWAIQEANKLSSRLKEHQITIPDLINEVNKSITFKPSQKNKEIQHMLELIRSSQTRRILEIGCFKGGTLALLCQVAPKDGLIISLDIEYPSYRKLANSRFARPGQKVVCIEGNSQKLETLQKVRRVLHGKELDLVFIDGDHTFFGVMNDYVLFSPLVRQGGVIALHDIQADSYMRTGVKTSDSVGEVPIFWSALKQSGLKTEEVIENPNQDGWGIGFIFKE